MKKIIPTFEDFINEDARDDVKKIKKSHDRKMKIKKDLIDKHRKEKKKKEVEKAEITQAEINIKDKEIDVLKDKASLIKQKEIFKGK